MPGSAQNLYDTISRDLGILRRSGLEENEINRLLHIDIQHYFQRFADQVGTPRDAPTNLVDERIAVVSQRIVQYAEEQLARTFPEKLALVLAMHLTSTIEHITHGRMIVEPAIQSVRFTYPIEYEVAQVALLPFRSELGVSLPESETDVLAVLLANADALLSSEQSTVGIVVAAHGRGIAAGLAELANTLVGVNSVRWVELTLEQSPEELLGLVAHWVRVADQGGGVLLFVDFVSLLSLGELVMRGDGQAGVQVRAIAGVSAPLVVEAVRRAQRSKSVTLDQLAASLQTFSLYRPVDESSKIRTSINRFPTSFPQRNAMVNENDGLNVQFTASQRSRVILSVCLTGFGSAAKIAELIEEHLPGLRQQGVEIICMDINLSGKTEADVQRLVGNRDVVAIVGTINPHLESYPFIALTDFLFGDGIARLRTLLGGTLIDPALLQPPCASEQVVESSDGFSGSVLPDNGSTPVITQRSELVREVTHTLGQSFISQSCSSDAFDRSYDRVD